MEQIDLVDVDGVFVCETYSISLFRTNSIFTYHNYSYNNYCCFRPS